MAAQWLRQTDSQEMLADVLASLTGGRNIFAQTTRDGQGPGGMEMTIEIQSKLVLTRASCGCREGLTIDAETQQQVDRIPACLPRSSRVQGTFRGQARLHGSEKPPTDALVSVGCS